MHDSSEQQLHHSSLLSIQMLLSSLKSKHDCFIHVLIGEYVAPVARLLVVGHHSCCPLINDAKVQNDLLRSSQELQPPNLKAA